MNHIVYALLETVSVLFMVFVGLILVGVIALFVRAILDHWQKHD